MITLIRKNQKSLLIIVTVVVIIAFAWLYNGTDLEKLGANRVATIYGKDLTTTDVQRRARLMNLAQGLGLYELVFGLGGQTMDRNRMMEGFIFNGIVLDHEAEKLGIEPTESQIADVLRSLPVFQTDGKFDIQRYTQFIERNLAPNGFSEQQLEEVVRSQLQLQEVRELVTSPVAVSDREARAEWERFNSEIDLAIARLELKTFSDAIQPTEEDIRAFHEARADTLRTDEKRSIQYVVMELFGENTQLEGRERIAELQKIADRAGEFTQRMLEEGAEFETVAAEYGLTVQSTPAFPRDNPPEAAKEMEAFASTAFSLTPDAPDSDAIEAENGFAILHLDGIEESRPMSLEEAKPEIIETIRIERGREQMERKGREAAEQLAGAGGQFTETAKELGLSVSDPEPFALSSPPEDFEDREAILPRLLSMDAGDVSPFIGTSDGGVIVRLDAKSPPDSAGFEAQRSQIQQSLARQKQQLAFFQWLLNRVEAADLQTAMQP